MNSSLTSKYDINSTISNWSFSKERGLRCDPGGTRESKN